MKWKKTKINLLSGSMVMIIYFSGLKDPRVEKCDRGSDISMLEIPVGCGGGERKMRGEYRESCANPGFRWGITLACRFGSFLATVPPGFISVGDSTKL